jgi:hypothetical protein
MRRTLLAGIRSSEIERTRGDKGPHPDLDSDFDLFCETLVPALGIAP